MSSDAMPVMPEHGHSHRACLILLHAASLRNLKLNPINIRASLYTARAPVYVVLFCTVQGDLECAITSFRTMFRSTPASGHRYAESVALPCPTGPNHICIGIIAMLSLDATRPIPQLDRENSLSIPCWSCVGPCVILRHITRQTHRTQSRCCVY